MYKRRIGGCFRPLNSRDKSTEQALRVTSRDAVVSDNKRRKEPDGSQSL